MVFHPKFNVYKCVRGRGREQVSSLQSIQQSKGCNKICLAKLLTGVEKADREGLSGVARLAVMSLTLSTWAAARCSLRKHTAQQESPLYPSSVKGGEDTKHLLWPGKNLLLWLWISLISVSCTRSQAEQSLETAD